MSTIAKNKINAIIPSIENHPEQYIEFCASMAKDFSKNVEFITAINPVKKVIEIGTGPLSMSSGNWTFEKYKKERIKWMKNKVEKFSKIWPKIAWKVKNGFLKEQLIEEEKKEQPLLWALMKKNSFFWLNEIFDTIETDLSKTLKSPVLNIPKGVEYKRPESIMVLYSCSPEKFNTEAIQSLKALTDFDVQYLINLENSDNLSEDLLKLNKFISDKLPNSEIILLPKENTLETINKLFAKKDPDWICIQDFYQTPWKRLVSDYSFNRILLNQNKPSLVI